MTHWNALLVSDNTSTINLIAGHGGRPPDRMELSEQAAAEYCSI